MTSTVPAAGEPTPAKAPLLFVAVLTYLRPLEEMDAAGADHVAWLERGYAAGVLLASGRRVPRTGGIILARGTSLTEIEAFLHTDPFQQRGLVSAEIYPFEAVMLSDALKTALASA